VRGCWRCGIVEAPSFIVVFGLVVDNDFHFFCKIEEFILRVLKIVFNGEGFKDVVEGLFFEINAQFGEGIVKTSAPILGATFARGKPCGSSFTSRIFSSATSLTASRTITCAVSSVPSIVNTLAPFTSATTWLLVTTYPSGNGHPVPCDVGYTG